MGRYEDMKETLGEFVDDPDRCIASAEGWSFGERVRVVDDDDARGGMVFAGDEGYLLIEEVGAAKYGTTRTAFCIVEPGERDPVEVNPYNLESA